MTLTALIATKHEIISGIPKMDLLINSSKYAARMSIVGLLQTHEMSILSNDRPLKIISEKAVSGGMPLSWKHLPLIIIWYVKTPLLIRLSLLSCWIVVSCRRLNKQRGKKIIPFYFEFESWFPRKKQILAKEVCCCSSLTVNWTHRTTSWIPIARGTKSSFLIDTIQGVTALITFSIFTKCLTKIIGRLRRKRFFFLPRVR